MTDLRYLFSSRDDLPDALFSMLGASFRTESSYELFSEGGRGAVLGFSSKSLELGYASPALVILPSGKTAELFSWLKTYAAETYPLSQFGRVVSIDDFRLVESLKDTSNVFWKRPDRWPSVVLGEILAQSDSEPVVASLPLSRANATFSFAVAKSAVAHRSDLVSEECIRRLRVLSEDKRFLDRSLSLTDIIPIWRRVGFTWDDNAGLPQLLKLIHEAQSKDLFEPPYVAARNKVFDELLSDSVEQRVLAFRQFVSVQSSVERYQTESFTDAFEIALAAFLVGRGTSHVFLLKDLARKHPSVYVWFGLFAGLAGPLHWDVAWARAAKGIEKTFNAHFSWAEPPLCDISWPEYSWVAATDNEKLITEVPKQLPKVLTIEIFPGATCQLRLKVANPVQKNQVAASEQIAENVSFPQSDLVYAFVKEFIRVSDRAKLDLGAVLGESPARSDTSVPPKRNKRTSSKVVK